MATDKELRDAAVAELKLTTAGWRKSNGNPNYPSGTAPTTTHWGKAMTLLEQIGQVAPPPPPGAPTGYFWKGDFASGVQDFSMFDMHDAKLQTFTDWAVGQTKDVTVVPKPVGSRYPWSQHSARVVCTNSLPSNSVSGQTVNLWQPGAYGHPWTNGNTVWCRVFVLLPNGQDPNYPGKITPVGSDGVNNSWHVPVEWHHYFPVVGGYTSTKLELTPGGWIFKPLGGNPAQGFWLYETNQVQNRNNGIGGGQGSAGQPIGGSRVPLKFNHWYDMLFRWKLSLSPTSGEIDWYVDGNLRVSGKFATLFQKSDGSIPGISFQAGMYRNYPSWPKNNPSNHTQTTNENEHVYIGPMLAGPTRASVGA